MGAATIGWSDAHGLLDHRSEQPVDANATGRLGQLLSQRSGFARRRARGETGQTASASNQARVQAAVRSRRSSASMPAARPRVTIVRDNPKPEW